MKYRRFAADHILPLFYPVRCPVCQDIVLPKGRMVCPGCEDRPAFIDGPACMKCGRPVGEGKEFCRSCETHPRLFDRGYALMRYDGIGQESIRNFKENGRQEYAAWYMEALVQRKGEALRKLAADGIVPVPLHPHRLRKRGYNQALLLAEALSVRLDIPVIDILRRTKDTGRLKKLGPEGRRKNMTGSIVSGALPDDVRRLILIDDIFTTGSIADACSAALKDEGAERIFLVTVCTAG